MAQALLCIDIHSLHDWKEFLEPVLFEALGYQLELPVQKAKFLHEVIDICPTLKQFITDATERSIQRPKDQHIQKAYYSGKKKQHTVKNGLYVHPKNKRILAITPTVLGKTSDKRIFDEDPNMLRLPPGSQGMGDLGYLGAKKSFPSRLLKFVHPQKKPKGKELTQAQKDTNQQISRIRVKVEHPLAFMKHFNILKHQFRNALNNTTKADTDNLEKAARFKTGNKHLNN